MFNPVLILTLFEIFVYKSFVYSGIHGLTCPVLYDFSPVYYSSERQFLFLPFFLEDYLVEHTFRPILDYFKYFYPVPLCFLYRLNIGLITLAYLTFILSHPVAPDILVNRDFYFIYPFDNLWYLAILFVYKLLDKSLEINPYLLNCHRILFCQRFYKFLFERFFMSR